MKKQTKLSCLQIPGLALALGITFVAATATATPYATCLTNNGGVISFRLNEAADNVKIIHNGGATTNDLGALPKGLTTTANLGVAGVYSVQVTKASGAGYLQGVVNQISSDSDNAVKFGTTNIRGLAVNRNTNSPYFGRIYVSVSGAGTVSSNQFNLGARTVSDGIYILNADQTDAVGQGDTPRTGGIKFDFYAANTESPGRITVGPDDTLYITDWSDANGAVWMTDANVATNSFATNVLFGIGGPTLETNIHGSTSSVYVEGSLAGNDLTIYSADEDIDPGNAVLKYSIGGGPVPYTSAASQEFTFGLAAQRSKILRGPDGKWYCSNRRADYASSSGLYVRSADGTTALWSSLTAWRTLIGNTGANDSYFSETRGFDVTPDGKYLATIKALTNLTAAPYNMAANTVLLLPLTDGIPNITNLVKMPTTPRAGVAWELAFDAAGNMYTLSADQGVRIYSPGGSWVATTGSDGTFAALRTQPDVTVVATVENASENGTTGEFTFTRSGGTDGYGNTNATLTVGYSVIGTAVNGVDYSTLSGAVTFPVGESSAVLTVTPLQDAIAEPTETVILTLTNSTSYLALSPSVTVSISDTNTPVLSVNSASPSMYERVENDYARVVVGRDLGDTNTTFWLFPENFTFGGTAVMNVDYVVNSNLFPHNVLYGDRTAVLRLVSPLNDSLLKGDRTIIIGMAPAAEFNVATNTVTTTIVDDENPAETILWSDNFNTDSSANYAVCLASLAGNDSYTIEFAMDYAGYGIPAAPHSSSDTLGLHLNLNKDYINGASGMNLYPTNVNFGTNFALRFDMFLFCATTATSEHSTFGINHSGNKTNWFRGSNYGYTNWTDYDGLFAAIQADGSGGTVVGDFMLYTAPRRTNSNIVLPTSRAIRNASTLTEVFKDPPFSGTAGSLGGVPANLAYPMDPQARTWADVELSQIIKFGQPVITLRVNHTVIYQYTNTQASSLIATNGTIMLGYCDAYDSANGDSWGVIYDNARVVSLDPLRIVTQPVGATVSLGGSTTLSVVTAGSVSGLTTYQWRLYGTNLPGATSASLPLNNVQFANYGNYTVVVSDGVISITSSAAVVAPPAPLIITPPASRAAVLGGTATFTVTAATYSGVTNYQWRFNGADLTGQTGSSLALANVQAGNFGAYTVRVSDGITAVTSAPNAVLSQALPPSIASTFNGSSFGLQFPSEPGVTYYVEWKGELTNGAWNPLSTNAGTGSPIAITDTPLTPPQRFYRVRVQ